MADIRDKSSLLPASCLCPSSHVIGRRILLHPPLPEDHQRRALRTPLTVGAVRLPLDRITPAAVRRWHAETSAATGPTAARQAYALLHAILATAVADDALPRNPCRIKGAGQARSDERPLLDVDQVQHLSAHMPENLRGLVDLAFWAHLRLGELLALRSIDMDPGTVAVQRQVVETDVGPVERAHRRRVASASSTSPRRASRHWPST